MTDKRLLVSVSIFLLFTFIMAGIARAEEHSYLAFEDDFEDGDLNGWESDSTMTTGWSIEDKGGRIALKGSQGGIRLEERTFSDFTLETNVFIERSPWIINFRELTDKRRYKLRIVDAQLQLLEDYYTYENVLDSVGSLLNPETIDLWHSVKIVCIGNNIKIFFDNELVIDYIDEKSPFLSGWISLSGAGPTSVYFDDIKIYTAPPLTLETTFPPAQTPAPTTTTPPTTTPAPTTTTPPTTTPAPTTTPPTTTPAPTTTPPTTTAAPTTTATPPDTNRGGINWEATGVGLAVIAATGGWAISKRKKRRVKGLLNEIERTYESSKEDISSCKAELKKLRKKSLDELKKDNIDEGSYEIIEKRIELCLKELKEKSGGSRQIVGSQCKKCGAHLPIGSYGQVRCEFCNTPNYVPIPGEKVDNV